jgi:1-aminocyclopropane-1-carboxylate deaminase/D-cysteine desulfhydrase-like pyridoxal-dependent ACC family enzyme
MDPAGRPSRFVLIDEPTPLHPLPRLSAALGDRAEVWIKREDLLPLGFGGNKLRNLEYLVADALAAGADTIVTVGRRWSNHARLTAAAGMRAGLAVHAVLTGPPEIAERSPNVGLCRLFGAVVHLTTNVDREERTRLADKVVEDLRGEGHRPYVIGAGGSGATGVLGQVRAARELADQARRVGIHVDGVVLATATGGTQAGLLAGLAGESDRPAIKGFAVAAPATELRVSVSRLLAELEPIAPSAGAADEVVPGPLDVVVDEPVDVVVDESQLGAGYGVRSAAADEAAELLARTEGILVDPIYTAKALAGLVAGVRSGRWDGRRVVFWHSGGLPGLFEPLDEPADEAGAPGR